MFTKTGGVDVIINGSEQMTAVLSHLNRHKVARHPRCCHGDVSCQLWLSSVTGIAPVPVLPTLQKQVVYSLLNPEEALRRFNIRIPSDSSVLYQEDAVSQCAVLVLAVPQLRRRRRSTRIPYFLVYCNSTARVRVALPLPSPLHDCHASTVLIRVAVVLESRLPLCYTQYRHYSVT